MALVCGVLDGGKLALRTAASIRVRPCCWEG